ncbi:hypothetical protein KP509_06G043200 [Ceratopteris richardii]|uniref:Uncharacterized protein n=1 Tax=Ceratopteris richardii TaxID=49495 RepID=A0A8T2UMG0_CERRI|nr:hypothetical protein KP509_06G043200 [Ceratopteris richardii]
MAAPPSTALVTSTRPATTSRTAVFSSTSFPLVRRHASGCCLMGRPRLHLVHTAATDPPPPPSETSESEPPSRPVPQQSVLEALDFSEVRSADDAQLLEDARYATSMGEKMSREQYAALRRKIGGTYRDFFKDSIEVEGDFVDEGWVDKSCRFCKKDTASEPRTVDRYGRYAHVTCLEKEKEKSSTGNFFTRLFGM